MRKKETSFEKFFVPGLKINKNGYQGGPVKKRYSEN